MEKQSENAEIKQNNVDQQIIISIGREFGSAGHEIAELVAKDMGIKLYDRRLLDEVALKYGMDPKELEKYDEVPRNRWFTRNVNGYSNSLSEAVAEMQSNFLKEKAESGESFVVVGRCAEIALAGHPALCTFFIAGDMEPKIQRVMKIYGLNKEEAISKIYRHDKKRRTYHDSYAKNSWGEAKSYDICINSSKIGIPATVQLIKEIAKQKINHKKQ